MLRMINILFSAFVALFMFACTSVQKPTNLVDVDKIYFDNVDENPMFEGKPAEEGFREFVSQKVIYRTEAMDNGITGRVFVKFFVEKDGSVSNAKIVGSAHSALEDEALRVVNLSPNWSPGRVGGRAVRMSYTIPINFRLRMMNDAQSSVDAIPYSKKAELSKNSLLLEEVDVLGVVVTKREHVVSHE